MFHLSYTWWNTTALLYKCIYARNTWNRFWLCLARKMDLPALTPRTAILANDTRDDTITFMPQNNAVPQCQKLRSSLKGYIWNYLTVYLRYIWLLSRLRINCENYLKILIEKETLWKLLNGIKNKVINPVIIILKHLS